MSGSLREPGVAVERETGRLMLGLSSLGPPTWRGGPWLLCVFLPFPLPHSDPHLRPRPPSCLSFPPCRAGLVWPPCSVAALVFSPSPEEEEEGVPAWEPEGVSAQTLCPGPALPRPSAPMPTSSPTSGTCASQREPLPVAGWAKFGRLHVPLSGCPWEALILGRVWPWGGSIESSCPRPPAPAGQAGKAPQTCPFPAAAD